MNAHKEKTIGIIIARMSSSRLPGKVLKPINNKPLLEYTLERLKAVNSLDEIWLATTQHPSDEKLALWGIQQGLHVLGYHGEMEDVVGRVQAVLAKSQADRFISVLGDTPFPDTRLMNQLLEALDQHPEWEGVQVVSDGQRCVHSGIACFRRSGWEKIETASQEQKYREHLASILREKPDLIQMGTFQDDPLYYGREYRLTVDTQADLELMGKIVQALQQPDRIFSMADIIHFLDNNPEVAKYNSHVRQKTIDDRSLNILMAIQLGKEFGFTHLARCKTMARALEENFAAGVTFWVDSGDGRDVTAEDIGRKVVEGGWSLPEVIRQQSYDKVVIDFRNKIAPSMIQSIRIANPDIPIIVVDNNGAGAIEADALIYPNSHTEPPLGFNGKVYRGAAYTILGDDFLYTEPEALENRTPDKPYILVAMGSRDPFDLTRQALEALADSKDCHIDVVVPPHYHHPENLEKLATKMSATVTIHWRLYNLRSLMSQAMVSVAAFGMTAYELAYMGVPALLYCHYVEEIEDLQRFARYGAAEFMGDARAFDAEKICQRVTELIQSESLRQTMREKGQRLVDLDSPRNVAEAIIVTTREGVPSAL